VKVANVTKKEYESLKKICEVWEKVGQSFPQIARCCPTDRSYYQRLQPVLDAIERGEEVEIEE